MRRTWQIPRRTFLKGVGATLALPWLEAMASTGSSIAPAPRRFAVIYIPNGANMSDWTPSTSGSDFELPYILQPLQPHRRDFQVLTGLAHDKARPNGDGAGDHARAAASFLTGCQARKTAGADIRVGISVDQIAAEHLGRETRLPSLELSCDEARTAGECDSGYSCAYQFNLSWRTESTPMPPETNPRAVFDRVFGSGTDSVGLTERRRQRRSILDAVRTEAQTLQHRLGGNDRRKLDEYLGSVRDLERRMERADQVAAIPENVQRPEGIPEVYAEHMRLMYDLMALAFETDSTRVATFILAHDGSNRPYPFIEVPEGHHDLSHHGNDLEKQKKIARINRFHVEQFGHFLNRLKSSREGEGTLLDHSMIVYGGGIGDGNRHNHDDLPILLAGGGGGTLNPGRHRRLREETPMTNLYLALLDRLRVPAERLGDSTGRLEDL